MLLIALAVLRVCADPNNMPFSNQQKQGFENRLAEMVARDLGARVEYTWLPQHRGYVRNMLNARKCDVLMQAPVGFVRTATTRPYYRSSYVFVSRVDRGLDLRSFDDPALRALRIGVQIIGDDYANTPPAHALGARGLGANVVGFPVYGDAGKPNPLFPILDAVRSGAVDVAVVWGPLAGWYARNSPVALKLRPVRPEKDGPFAFAMGMGVRKDDATLRRKLDGVIARRHRDIEALLARFGVPMLP
jgi:quinoprotein dehydrogenase-associated probable ABC transporter substrate-binding protein